MDIKSVQLDTSFCIRLLNESDALHSNVLGFFRYFLKHEIQLKFSTISIAEYCVRGSLDELPLRNLEILPFNANHAVRAGEFAKITFQNKGFLGLSNRLIIPNDTKLFAQADVDSEVSYFATSDVESIKIHNLLQTETTINFEIINIRESYSTSLGILPFDD